MDTIENTSQVCRLSPEIVEKFENIPFMPVAESKFGYGAFSVVENEIRRTYIARYPQHKQKYLRSLDLAYIIYGRADAGTKDADESVHADLLRIIEDAHLIIPSPSLACLVLIMTSTSSRVEFVKAKLDAMKTMNPGKNLSKDRVIQEATKLVLKEDLPDVLHLFRKFYDPQDYKEYTLLQLSCLYGSTHCFKKEMDLRVSLGNLGEEERRSVFKLSISHLSTCIRIKRTTSQNSEVKLKFPINTDNKAPMIDSNIFSQDLRSREKMCLKIMEDLYSPQSLDEFKQAFERLKWEEPCCAFKSFSIGIHIYKKVRNVPDISNLGEILNLFVLDYFQCRRRKDRVYDEITDLLCSKTNDVISKALSRFTLVDTAETLLSMAERVVCPIMIHKDIDSRTFTYHFHDGHKVNVDACGVCKVIRCMKCTLALCMIIDHCTASLFNFEEHPSPFDVRITDKITILGNVMKSLVRRLLLCFTTQLHSLDTSDNCASQVFRSFFIESHKNLPEEFRAPLRNCFFNVMAGMVDGRFFKVARLAGQQLEIQLEQKKLVPDMKHFCRLSTLKNLKPGICPIEAIRNLEIPSTLRQYLLFEI